VSTGTGHGNGIEEQDGPAAAGFIPEWMWTSAQHQTMQLNPFGELELAEARTGQRMARD